MADVEDDAALARFDHLVAHAAGGIAGRSGTAGSNGLGCRPAAVATAPSSRVGGGWSICTIIGSPTSSAISKAMSSGMMPECCRRCAHSDLDAHDYIAIGLDDAHASAGAISLRSAHSPTITDGEKAIDAGSDTLRIGRIRTG